MVAGENLKRRGVQRQRQVNGVDHKKRGLTTPKLNPSLNTVHHKKRDGREKFFIMARETAETMPDASGQGRKRGKFGAKFLPISLIFRPFPVFALFFPIIYL